MSLDIILKSQNNNDDLDFIYDNYICFHDYLYDKKKNETIIYLCIRNNYKNLFNFILQKKCDINHQNIYKGTPLKTAVIQNKPYYVEKLLENNADINLLDKNNFKPSDYIMINKHPNYICKNKNTLKIKELFEKYKSNIKDN